LVLGFKPEPLKDCLSTVKSLTEFVIEENNGTDFKIFLSGKDNFREKVAVTYPYKAHRWNGKKRDQMRKAGMWLDWLDSTESKFVEPRSPHHMRSVRDFLVKEFGAIVADGQEADDLMGIHQTESTVICTTDKDLNMVSGWHMKIPVNGASAEKFFIEPDVAIRNFYKQLLTGDTTDNIVGLHGIGPAKAEKIIGSCEDEEEMFNACLCMYGGDYNRTIENGRLLWIRQEEGQLWEPSL
jgi:hypothetical protein